MNRISLNRFLLLTIGVVLSAIIGSYAFFQRGDPQRIAEPLPGAKQLPVFTLPRLDDPNQSFNLQAMQGKVWILNAWASWCVSCRTEHPVLLAFSKQALVPVIGLDYLDARADARKWLDEAGNPYQTVVFDADGKVGTAYGILGLPATLVIDQRGMVRLKHSGPLTPEIIQEKFLPLIKELTAR
ncbi:MAG: DsbE family thiol:disulfide interchange protein [Burkholderiaceae bacterium]